MSRWFRWYEGTTEDGKFRSVARNADVTVATVMGVWAVLLEDASHPNHRGIATRGEDFWGSVLDLHDSELVAILSAMEGMGLISVGHGDITITKWKERQFETDTSDATNAARQRKWREKQKQTSHETQRNGHVTAAKRPDTDTDTEKKDISPEEASVEQQFETFWAECPLKKSKGQALKAFRTALKKPGVTLSVLVNGIRRYRQETRETDPKFIKHPSTWLNGECWADEAVTASKVPKPGNMLAGSPEWHQWRREMGIEA